jgi:iron complex transport system ATP-binding protein
MASASCKKRGVLVNAAFRLIDLKVGYPDRLVLSDISLSIPSGVVFAIVGPNGVGKSTLIKASSGILPIIKGQIRINDQNLKTFSPSKRARRIGVVPQATHIPPYFTAQQVVLMGRTPYLGWLSREQPNDIELAETAMRRTSTLELADRRIGELSGGEAQRVLIARSLAQSPSVLLLDEPTAHLDLRHQDETLNLIQRLARESSLSVLIALHDLNLVARYADQVALLSNGTIKNQGVPRDVLTPGDLAEAYGIEIHIMDHPIHGTPLVLSG